MEIDIDKLIEEITDRFKSVKTLNDLQLVKTEYMGKNSVITKLKQGIKDAVDKKSYGMNINKIQSHFNSLYDLKKKEIDDKIIADKLNREKIDITLPATSVPKGSLHPMTLAIERIEDLFVSMGYDVVEGPELETDEYCFARLNLPLNHPARDMQDSFYITNEVLLRTQTSSVQARFMEQCEGKKPIRIIVPGKTYRREDDATHSPQFSQIEGLVIDKKENNVSLADLKGTLEIFAKTMLGQDATLRFRPSFFPFTEPSYEVDVVCFKCHGKGCSLCKKTGYIEVFAAGIVHPNVLRMNGYDPDVWGGFAFGPGWDRITMFRYEIPDVRLLYQNDIRFLQEFDRRDDSI